MKVWDMEGYSVLRSIRTITPLLMLYSTILGCLCLHHSAWNTNHIGVNLQKDDLTREQAMCNIIILFTVMNHSVIRCCFC